MKHTLVLAGAVAAALLLSGCGHTYPVTSGTATPSPPYVPNVSSEYPIPTANSQPAGITRTSTALFFTEEAGDKLGVLTQNATITEYTLPEPNSEPLNLTLGQDGNIWLTEFGGDRIAEFNLTSAGFTECTLPIQTGVTPTPYGIAAGPDGNLWVTDPASNGIWRVAPGCGSFGFFALTTPNATPKISPSAPMARSGLPSTTPIKSAKSLQARRPALSRRVQGKCGRGPWRDHLGVGHALWFTETKTDKLGRMLTTGQLASETLLAGVGQPYGLVNAPDGNFYIGDQTKSQIAQVIVSTTPAKINLYPTKTSNAGPFWLTIGPDNEIYFTEQTANNIGQFKYF